MLSQCGRFVPAVFVGVESIKGNFITTCLRRLTVVRKKKDRRQYNSTAYDVVLCIVTKINLQSHTSKSLPWSSGGVDRTIQRHCTELRQGDSSTHGGRSTGLLLTSEIGRRLGPSIQPRRATRRRGSPWRYLRRLTTSWRLVHYNGKRIR